MDFFYVGSYFLQKNVGISVKDHILCRQGDKSESFGVIFPCYEVTAVPNVLCVKDETRKKERIMEASVAIQVLPKAESDDEVCRIVDEVIAYIASTGLNYYVGPCETSIEGDYDTLMEIVKNCQKIAIKAGCASVSSYVKISYRPEGEVLTIDRKISKYHE